MARQTTLLFALMAVGISLTLFLVKYRVQDLEDQLLSIERTVAEDRQAIHVLNAEWSHLNEPNRLRDLAERHLGLVPLKTGQIATPFGLDGLLTAPGSREETPHAVLRPTATAGGSP